jgi:ATP-dependent phosphoenolpyruvate carboxykinase
MMIYYKIKEEEENKETLVKHAVVGISEDNKYDADAVLEFEKQAFYAISHLLLLPSSPENMTRVHFKVLLHFCSNPSVKGMNIYLKQCNIFNLKVFGLDGSKSK